MSNPLPNLPRLIRNREIMLRHLEGQSNETIAEFCGLATATIDGILRSPLVQHELQRLRGELEKDLISKVKARSHEALETVTDVMRGEVGSELRFKAAKEILDRNPELQPKQQDLAGAIGAGMGEYIVRELARRRAEGESNERAGNAGGASGGAGEDGGRETKGLPGSGASEVRDHGGDDPVEGEVVDSGAGDGGSDSDGGAAKG